jgi:hypothetical protein
MVVSAADNTPKGSAPVPTAMLPCRMVHNAAFLLANYLYKFSSEVTYGKAAGTVLVQAQ